MMMSRWMEFDIKKKKEISRAFKKNNNIWNVDGGDLAL